MRRVFGVIGFIAVFVLLGLVLAVISGELFAYYAWTDNVFTGLLLFTVLFSLLILAYLVQIVLHELGHLVFGLASGYTFVSFRVGSLTVVKDDGKFRLKKYNIPGTGGQCLMMPPEQKNGKYPYVIYNLGGVLFNFILSILALLPIIFVEDLSAGVWALLVLFIIAGVIGVLTNGIPLKIGGIANDASNILSLNKDPSAREGFYLQLRVNGLQSAGMRIKDMDHKLFKLDADADLSNPLNTGIKLMEHNWYLDNQDFANARAVLESLVPYFNKLLPLYVYEINSERIFLELIGDNDKELIDRLYTKTLQKYIKQSKFMMNKTRLMLAYEAFYNMDRSKAEDQYNLLRKMYDNYPNKGETDMELMLADWVMERIDKNEHSTDQGADQQKGAE